MEQRDITTALGRIRVYSKNGGAKAVVLLHGGGCDSAMLSWREVMDSFGDDFTVYAPDLLGYGQSDKPHDLCGPDFYEKHIAAVKEVVDTLGLTEFALAGLSMGGAIAIGFALRHPKYIDLLIPVDSWGLSAKLPMHRLSNWYIHHTNFTLSQYRLLAKSRWLARWSVSYSLIGDREKITDALIDEVMEACRGGNAGQSMQDFQRSSSTKDGAIPFYINDLAKLEMPVIFVGGEKDPLVPRRDMIAAAKRTKANQYCELKGCKHWAVKERPGEFVDLIAEAAASFPRAQ